MRRKAYISLPISGLDIAERKRYARDLVKRIRKMGYQPVNPLENGLPESASHTAHMERDLELLRECEVMIQCDGWEQSQGCMIEYNYCVDHGLSMISEYDIETEL